ncbi:RNA polymerase sigma-70 factor, ECF subfamily [Clostridium amylolyticum]|uniref:RNA polymerase sigma factor n=1 Tax=Clostridium amylolyticum TaxID=1121298 RepID=A0A1M6PCE7_9CLOT|nr:sigma-70 family RNA polymerase sigma factor [Clostridium amylolyticum]SHK05616.1 RNA polymerase sigma-70 factor, ECF subfamily [Clostridium amylolyticum]
MEDKEIVERILNGDVQAFELIINRYEMSIARFIYQMVRDKETAEDLTQEVFILAYNKLFTYKPDYMFSAWLYRIARNKTIDYIRKEGKVKSVNIEDIGSICSKESSLEEVLEYRELKENIENFVNTLDIIDKQILTLRYTKHELTFNDIAHMLNMSLCSVKKRYYKIYDKYKKYVFRNKSVKRGEGYELQQMHTTV